MREGVRREKGLAVPESWPTGSTRTSRVVGVGVGETRKDKRKLPFKPGDTHCPVL